ncbi:hypothetical protein GXN76_02130 [Kroppenstedtia pulmonis]|uniref:Uncharacterized protein n=1 Tax=Kroppenstedtia pulmonis TaxID=1380685 RepID=A0A7D4B166_9BACL|nr:hypothetical protein [Kroppenstedtia pulmonis]QKG83386.1 hypothetical protein GXN76_02130 [Kroppenstedtia pulmonis]
MDDRLGELNHKLDQVTNLLIKASFDTSLNAFILEDLFVTSKGNKERMEQYHTLAAQYLQSRLVKEGLDSQIAAIVEENEQLKRKVMEDNEEIQKLKSQIQQLYVRDQESGNKIREYQEKMKAMEQKEEDMTKWTNGLVHELKIRYSRLKSNETIIQDYIQQNPAPKGTHF